MASGVEALIGSDTVIIPAAFAIDSDEHRRLAFRLQCRCLGFDTSEVRDHFALGEI